jgi:hypothetical protein
MKDFSFNIDKMWKGTIKMKSPRREKVRALRACWFPILNEFRENPEGIKIIRCG